jgi:hypothetical protein
VKPELTVWGDKRRRFFKPACPVRDAARDALPRARPSLETQAPGRSISLVPGTPGGLTKRAPHSPTGIASWSHQVRASVPVGKRLGTSDTHNVRDEQADGSRDVTPRSAAVVVTAEYRSPRARCRARICCSLTL